MRKLRTCESAHFNTGASKCPPDFGKMIGAIIVADGYKLPAELTADKLEEAAHAAVNERVYGIFPFVEYAKNGGEAQTSVNGYGPEEFTGFSARKDTFTPKRFDPALHAALTRTAHLARGAYFFDENNVLYGINDGTDTLAPFPMACIYSDATPHPTSSAKATMNVTFAHEDAKKAVTEFDYVMLDFNPAKLVLGLVEVEMKKVGTSGSSYKIFEKVGGYDVTPIYGPLIASASSTVLLGTTTAVAYDASGGTLTISASSGAEVRLKSPDVLYGEGIKGIEQV